MLTIACPVIQLHPRLVVAQYADDTGHDMGSEDLTARVQLNMRSVRSVQVSMFCTGESETSGDTSRLRVGLCLHPVLDEITEAARYRGLTGGVSPYAAEGGANWPWLADGGASGLFPAVVAVADEAGQSQNGGLFEAEFPAISGGSPVRARYVNFDWRMGNVSTGVRLRRLTLYVHTAD